MSAGTGLRHEEHNIGDEEVQFLQIWIEPKLQNIQPRYQKRYFPQEKRKNKLQTIVSSEEGADHCWINQNAVLALGWFEAGKTLSYKLDPSKKAVYFFVLEGKLSIDGKPVHKRDAIGVWDTDIINLQVEEESQFVVVEAPVNH
jgi:redox-sensitive bicupin YhaK (pirin superfamily)